MAKKKSIGGKFLMKLTGSAARLFFDILFYSIAIIGILFLTKYSYRFCYQLFGPVSVDSEENAKETEFYIEPGDSTKEVAKKLERCGLVVNDTTFYIKTKMLNATIMPGDYMLNSGMDYEEILTVISDYGKTTDSDTEEAAE